MPDDEQRHLQAAAEKLEAVVADEGLPEDVRDEARERLAAVKRQLGLRGMEATLEKQLAEEGEQ